MAAVIVIVIIAVETVAVIMLDAETALPTVEKICVDVKVKIVELVLPTVDITLADVKVKVVEIVLLTVDIVHVVVILIMHVHLIAV